MHPMYQKADALFADVLDAASYVEKVLGIGLLEKVYQFCLTKELRYRGHEVEREVRVKVAYRGESEEMDLRVDLLVDKCLIVELKSMTGAIRLEYIAQTLSYMRMLNIPLALIYNYGPTTADRAKRVILSGADEP